MGLQTRAVIYYGFPFFNAETSAEDDSVSIMEHDRLICLVDEDSDTYPEQGKKDGEAAIGMSGDYGTLDSFNQDTIWYYVYIIGSFRWGGYEAAEIKPQHMVVEYDGWRETLSAFCDKYNIPWQEPGWKLTVKRS